MVLRPDRPLGIFYEHPDWFRPLFAELERRGVPYVALHAATHRFDPDGPRPPYALVFNRMSPSAYARGLGSAVGYALAWLEFLEARGVRVVNGSAAFRTEISKVRQLQLMSALGLPHPRTRVLHRPEEAVAAAAEIGYPVVVKPNVGGSGVGLRRFDTAAELEAAVAADGLDFGLDGVGLVQEAVPAEARRIVRVEVLGRRFLYAIRLYLSETDVFNLCPADVCRRIDGATLERAACPVDAEDRGLRVEGYAPPAAIVAQVERLMAAAGIEVGGVEYLVDERTGQVVFYDVNALSNFVADAPRVVGLDPWPRLVDYLLQEAR
jgi:biotin carboxylase